MYRYNEANNPTLSEDIYVCSMVSLIIVNIQI